MFSDDTLNSSSNTAYIDDIKQVILNADESIKNAEKLLIESSDNESDIQLLESVGSLLQVINKISSMLDIDLSEDENQFRFDIDGIEKVEEEYLNKMFIDE